MCVQTISAYLSTNGTNTKPFLFCRSRSQSDTFYKDEKTVLRTHTSAHQTQLMRQGERAFLVAGDCYRRDEIDPSHYPVFHQMEGVRLFKKDEVQGTSCFQ